MSCLQIVRGLSQIVFPTVSVIMTGSEGLGCDANILFKAHLDFDDVDVWLAKLVQGGYIQVHSTRPPIAEADFYWPIFVCLEISNS